MNGQWRVFGICVILVWLSFQVQDQLQAEALRYKAKIEDLENELNLKGQVGGLPHTHRHTDTATQHVAAKSCFRVNYNVS